uniref:Uncharacterized protein n=1 Tax=Micrurus lemniscatus lemniscatus TaxID=129467 RepID=A0A2D4JS66_MICLE
MGKYECSVPRVGNKVTLNHQPLPWLRYRKENKGSHRESWKSPVLADKGSGERPSCRVSSCSLADWCCSRAVCSQLNILLLCSLVLTLDERLVWDGCGVLDEESRNSGRRGMVWKKKSKEAAQASR